MRRKSKRRVPKDKRSKVPKKYLSGTKGTKRTQLASVIKRIAKLYKEAPFSGAGEGEPVDTDTGGGGGGGGDFPGSDAAGGGGEEGGDEVDSEQ